jgi:hypothetical protein
MQSKLLLACFYLLGMGVVCNWVALLQCQDYLGPLFTVGSACRTFEHHVQHCSCPWRCCFPLLQMCVMRFLIFKPEASV